mmetsp:Transcript_18158/g.50859  ORF Transcript_18158/g.50859 Transcript_18158/m.50859 type:complete len:202 (-) Transcript_18158:30-635(-)
MRAASSRPVRTPTCSTSSNSAPSSSSAAGVLSTPTSTCASASLCARASSKSEPHQKRAPGAASAARTASRVASSIAAPSCAEGAAAVTAAVTCFWRSARAASQPPSCSAGTPARTESSTAKAACGCGSCWRRRLRMRSTLASPRAPAVEGRQAWRREGTLRGGSPLPGGSAYWLPEVVSTSEPNTSKREAINTEAAELEPA